MPIQHTTSENKWELLLKTIGAKEVKVTNVTDSKITIEVDLDNLKYLRKLFDSTDTSQKNILPSLFCSNRNINQKLATQNSCRNFNIKQNWFRRVVNDDFINSNNLSEILDDMTLNLRFNEELLIIELQFKLLDLIPLLRCRLCLTKLQCAITDEKTLAKILAGEEPIIAEHSNESPTKFAQVISKIISDENNYTINFIINNGAFAQTFQSYEDDGKPPIIASDLNGSFIIDKQNLLIYLTPIYNGIIWNEKEKIPIVFNAKEPESSTKLAAHDFNILIDTSGSMSPNFDVYINNIKDILDKLSNIPNWQINIVRFSTYSTARSFSLKNGDTIDDIKKHIENFDADGATRLYCTVQEALEEIRAKLTVTPDLYSTLMVFTDGENNVIECTEDDVINAASYLKGIPQFNMYGIGFGETGRGHQKFFKRIAEEGGFIHIKLDDPNGMTHLQQYISTLTQKINVWEIQQGELKLSVSKVPEGDVFMIDQLLKCGANEYVFKKNGEKI